MAIGACMARTGHDQAVRRIAVLVASCNREWPLESSIVCCRQNLSI